MDDHGSGYPVSMLGFEIRLSGPIPEKLLAELGPGVRVVVEPVATVLSGPVADQLALQRIITQIQGLGLELVEIRRLNT